MNSYSSHHSSLRAASAVSGASRWRRWSTALTPALAAVVMLATAGCSMSASAATVTPKQIAATPVYGPDGYGRYGLPFDRDPTGDAPSHIEALAKKTSAVDNLLLNKIASTPITTWFGDWNTTLTATVKKRVDGAASRNGVASLATYNIPDQDCGSYGRNETETQTYAQHRAWVRAFVKGLGAHKAIVIVEVDALAHMTCLTPPQVTARLSLIKYEVDLIAAQGSWAYIDIGHAAWQGVGTMATRLKEAGIADAAGFSVNAGNSRTTAESIRYGTAISKLVGDAHFVVDTSRNGVQPKNSAWCNAPGKGLGVRPTTHTASKLVDAYLWIKEPGASDGTCRGGPKAGEWIQSYAIMLARNASW